MARFIAIIDRNEDGTLFASFPDAPGCTAGGGTEEEVITAATEALAEWASDVIAGGLELPQPRSFADLMQTDEFAQLTSGGSIVATVPMLKLSGKLAKANISLDAGLLENIDEEATRRGMTRSAFLASAAMEKLLAAV
ncbi:MAG TPA: type II toxin-antitoxin system HicB family antitoxin [Devosia sp.]|nr:type II toxin-antitoxin system HicB family antitoxin [Devosia sp.]